MDALRILVADHRFIEKLFAEVTATNDRELEGRRRLFRDLWKAIEDHELIEETKLYPEIDKVPAAKELVANALDEHAELEAIFQQISQLNVESDEWLERIKELGELIRQHGREEEEKLFPIAERQLSRARADLLGRQIQQRRAGKPPTAVKRASMKALVYHGPGQKELREQPAPELATATDAVVKVIKTTICGTDLHILKGDVPTCTLGRILGHEGIGIIDKIAPGVTRFREGDRVLISCISACGKCANCRRGMYSHCATGGWLLGNRIDGTQAEYVRVPHADTSLHPMPDRVADESVVMLSDILPTGFECGVLNGRIEPGGTVAIVGAGPIGLASLLTAQLYSPAEIIMIDLDDNRLDVSKRLGATAVISAAGGGAAGAVMRVTGGRGVDTAIEAVGVPETFVLCQDIVAPGGVIANIGVHGAKADLHLERLWSRNITITTRLVDTITTPMLLRTVEAGKIDPLPLITHRFKLDQIVDAYDTFAEAAHTRALKVIIET